MGKTDKQMESKKGFLFCPHSNRKDNCLVCGVSEQTTCQEVVIALAQAIGEFPEAQMGPAGGLQWRLASGSHLAPRRVGLLLVRFAFPQLLKPDGLKVRDVG